MRRLLLTGTALAIAGLPAFARAEIAYLECTGRYGETSQVTIDFDTRAVVVLGHPFRWQASAQITEDRISWETQSQKGANFWVINRYTLELSVRGPGFALGYDCKKLAKPPQRKL